jgi:hypothetical protein
MQSALNLLKMLTPEEQQKIFLAAISKNYVESPRSALFPILEERGARNLLRALASLQLDEQFQVHNAAASSPTDGPHASSFATEHSSLAFIPGEIDEKLVTYCESGQNLSV